MCAQTYLTLLTLDHVTHKLLRVASDWVELQSMSGNKVMECSVCANAYTVSVSLELLSQRNIRLNVP